MLNWLKKHLVPHEGNEHRPHFLRTKSVTIFLGAVLFIEATFLFVSFALTPTLNWLSSIAPSVLVEYTNTSRAEASLNTLTTNVLLQQAAQFKANDMAAKGYFAHTSPDGTEPWDWLKTVGYDYQTAGENLAVNFIDSADVHEAWMNSPTHRANILKNDYTEIGIASARGVYKGYESIYVAQFFGRPRLETIVASDLSLTKQTPSTDNTPTPIVSAVTTTSPISSALEPSATPLAPILKTNTFITFSDAQATENDVPLPSTASTAQKDHPSTINKILSSPRNLANYLLYALASIAVVALGLAVFARLEHYDGHLVLNGVLITTVVFAMILVNHYLGFIQTTIV
jgi:hypothetical protein